MPYLLSEKEIESLLPFLTGSTCLSEGLINLRSNLLSTWVENLKTCSGVDTITRTGREMRSNVDTGKKSTECSLTDEQNIARTNYCVGSEVGSAERRGESVLASHKIWFF
jgi:hypothetical protein